MSEVSSTTSIPYKNQLFRALAAIAAVELCRRVSNIEYTTSNSSHYIILLHLITFASWFGCSIWVSFIAGIVMFKNLPRHVFGRLNARLFPAYFQFSVLMNLLAIATSGSVMGLSSDSNSSPTSLWVILTCTLLNLFYFEPATTRIMYKRHAVEKTLGTGHEVGKLKPDDPKKANDPKLVALSKTFGMLHGVSTLLVLGSLGCGCVWLSECAGRMVEGSGK